MAFFRQIQHVVFEIRRLLQMVVVQVCQVQWPRHAREVNEVHLSLIVPAYNVAPYLDDFFESIFTQSSRSQDFEIIIINDGSTDETPQIVQKWLDRHPTIIRTYSQANAGAAAARNAGLVHAKGTWVGFPDPDDFFDKKYFVRMRKETTRVLHKPVLAIVSNMIFYHEDGQRFADNHPLQYRFQYGKVYKETNNLEQHVVLSAATCWFRRENIQKSGIAFDSRVKPAFEDAHFINRLFLAAPQHTVTFVQKARYLYRKRSAQTSQLDRAKAHPGWFSDQLQYGNLDLLRKAHKKLGYVPKSIQRTCLYPIVWQLRTLTKEPERASALSRTQRNTYNMLLTEIFAYIDAETIAEFELARCTEDHKVALLARYKKQRRKTTRVYVHQLDLQTGRAQFSYFTGGTDYFSPHVQRNGQKAELSDRTTLQHNILDQPYSCEQFFWISFHRGDKLHFSVDGTHCTIWRRSIKLGTQIRWPTLRLALWAAPPTKPKVKPIPNTSR